MYVYINDGNYIFFTLYHFLTVSLFLLTYFMFILCVYIPIHYI